MNIFRVSVLCFTLFIGLSACKTKKVNNSFISIFDGQTLTNWKGDPVYWSVENGNLVGVVTPETLLKSNSFIVWQGGQPENFELKLEYRISEDGNSGVNYRSEIIENKPFALRGYQADIDGKQKYTGQNYEEKKRTTLAYIGEKVYISTQMNPDEMGNLRSNVKNNCWQSRAEIESLGEADSLKAKIKSNDWNQVHLIVNNTKLQHYVNGILMSEVIDNDTINRSFKGYIGVQVHVGPPMKVEYRNIFLKEL